MNFQCSGCALALEEPYSYFEYPTLGKFYCFCEGCHDIEVTWQGRVMDPQKQISKEEYVVYSVLAT